ncbi:BamA/TamA family outer membrane protein [Chitinophaga sp. XS-30]|uniref:translocation and assembly module lipoprotein TamL n=1 Tax=Chitinophaga sp. XS-30 TaxID=2604421 RepID=UPI0011DE0D96|nr:BamA/TamA family outer membrane protein [Chitinophaga sp. XS-30]QEH43419.1 BamA/TamA family outer membrane protein [Chitinophaga sp. XS-30]
MKKKSYPSYTSLPLLPALLMVCLLLNACSNTRYLQQDQTLLTKTNVVIDGTLSSSEKSDLKSDLSSKSLMLQQPNSKLLGSRLKVWLYNQKSYEKKSNWFWNLILAERNLEAPVIYDSVRTAESVSRMVSYLNNQGYFYATVDHKVDTRNRKTDVTYEVTTGKNFVIKKINYDIPDTALRHIVREGEKFSLLKVSEPYKAENLNGERERLTRLIRDAGYFKFNRDLITFTVDTLNKSLFIDPLNPFSSMPSVLSADQKPTMEIDVVIRNPEDSATDLTKLFYLHDIFIYPDFSPNGNVNDTTYKTFSGRILTVKYHEDIIRPRVLARAIQLRKNERYSIQNYNNTVNRLYDLNLWQFVTVQYRERTDTVQKLDAYVLLTPRKKQELSANIDVTTSNDYLVGSGVTLGYRHYNVSRSANELHITLKGGLEVARNDRFDLQAREYGVNADLVLPRFMLPFRLRQNYRSTARTRISAGWSNLTRIRKFDIRQLTASLGYEWNESLYKRWIVKPFMLNYVGVALTKEFQDSVVTPNPYLRRSFEPAFIGGEGITYTFSNNDIFHKRQNSYFRINFEESGLWLKGINGLTNWVTSGRESLETLSTVNISQFLRLELDYRHYWNYSKSSVATRAYAGVGIPYGQSDVLPYIRQFTSGGPNSLRAWRLRTLGPGSFRDTSSIAEIFPDQTGDLKLEGNVEYRFNLFRLFGGSMNLKGATFLDFGNIWMLKQDTLRAGADFRFDNLYNDLAIGTGAGLRLDFTYFLIRFDWGIPLKKPYPTEKNKSGWFLNQWALGDVRWRRENIIWNIAIGYPF